MMWFILFLEILVGLVFAASLFLGFYHGVWIRLLWNRRPTIRGCGWLIDCYARAYIQQSLPFYIPRSIWSDHPYVQDLLDHFENLAEDDAWEFIRTLPGRGAGGAFQEYLLHKPIPKTFRFMPIDGGVYFRDEKDAIFFKMLWSGDTVDEDEWFPQ